MFWKNHLRSTLVCLVLALGTAWLYSPALRFDFVPYDDQLYLLNNFHVIQGWRWHELAWSFQAGYCNNWHPLTWMSHMLDCQLFGLRPAGHHAVNVLLHTLNSVLVFLVLRSMTGAFWRSAVVAALFAWHPLHVESVAWVSERKDVLSTFFGLLTLWAYARYTREVGKNYRFYGLALVLFALGLMAKPMLVTLPFVLLLLDGWPLGRLARKQDNPPGPPLSAECGRGVPPHAAGPPLSAGYERILALLIEKIPFLLLSAVSGVLTFMAQSNTGAVRSLEYIPLKARLANAAVAYVSYIEKLIWPANLSIFYPLDKHLPAWRVAAAGLALAAVSAAAVSARKQRPYLLTGWLWYLGTLVPVIGLVQVGDQAMADRYSYLPSIGLFTAICWEAGDIALPWRYSRPILVALAASTLGACIVVTGQQLQYWRDGGTLFLHAIAVTPNSSLAHATYGSFLFNHRNLEKARGECELAIHLAPDYPQAHLELGNTLFLQGNLDEAARQARLTRVIEPHSPEACHLLGEVLLAQKQPAQAAAQFALQLQLDPDNPGAHCHLGKALAAQDKLDEACAEFAEAIRLIFQFPEAHYQWALALQGQHKTKEAISHYRTALQLQPDYPEALNNLAWILAADPRPEFRDGPEAVKLAARACALTGDKQPLLIGTLAAAYAEAGQFDKAMATAQKAHDLAKTQGDDKLAARNLELLQMYRDHHAYHET